MTRKPGPFFLRRDSHIPKSDCVSALEPAVTGFPNTSSMARAVLCSPLQAQAHVNCRPAEHAADHSTNAGQSVLYNCRRSQDSRARALCFFPSHLCRAPHLAQAHALAGLSFLVMRHGQTKSFISSAVYTERLGNSSVQFKVTNKRDLKLM